MLLELLRHTDAVVLDAEHIGGAAAARARLFHDADVDGAARRGEFYGIADDVQQNLVQAQLVGDDILVLDILRIYIQIQLLGADIALYDGAQVVQHIGQMHGGVVQLDGAAFNAAHIQIIVDQAEQMLPRHADFLAGNP